MFRKRSFFERLSGTTRVEREDDEITIIRRIDTRQVLGAIDRDLSDAEWSELLATVRD